MRWLGDGFDEMGTQAIIRPKGSRALDHEVLIGSAYASLNMHH